MKTIKMIPANIEYFFWGGPPWEKKDTNKLSYIILFLINIDDVVYKFSYTLFVFYDFLRLDKIIFT
jgi:hypothetical protein